MSRPTSEAGELARSMATQFPDSETLTLARILLRQYPEVYRSIEHARNAVRYYRGEKGHRDREKLRNSGSGVPTTKWAAPESDADKFSPMSFDQIGSGLIIGDPHIPYHDKAALETAVEYAQNRGHTDYLIILGDLMDAYQISVFCKDPRKRNIAGEAETAVQFLKDMKGIFGTVLLKAGNHDRRVQDYVFKNAPALVGLPGVEFENILTLKEIGVGYVDWDTPVYIGDHLTLIHGHEYGRGVFSPVNAARGLFLRSLACSVTAHYHRPSHHDEADIRGRDISTWSVGCMCDLHPRYAPLNKWRHGFALIDTDGGDGWNLSNHRIVEGHVR